MFQAISDWTYFRIVTIPFQSKVKLLSHYFRGTDTVQASSKNKLFQIREQIRLRRLDKDDGKNRKKMSIQKGKTVGKHVIKITKDPEWVIQILLSCSFDGLNIVDRIVFSS